MIRGQRPPPTFFPRIATGDTPAVMMPSKVYCVMQRNSSVRAEGQSMRCRNRQYVLGLLSGESQAAR